LILDHRDELLEEAVEIDVVRGVEVGLDGVDTPGAGHGSGASLPFGTFDLVARQAQERLGGGAAVHAAHGVTTPAAQADGEHAATAGGA
jgi:hypothetical protein